MAFAQILRDEVGHVAFHCDTLHRAFEPYSPTTRRLIRRAWRLMFRIVCLVVMIDHVGVLCAARRSPGAFWRDCSRIFDDVAARIFSLGSMADQPPMEIKTGGSGRG